MPRWNVPRAKIVTETGTIYRQPVSVALALVRSGLAYLQFNDPLTVRVIPVERIGAAFIPTSCKNFIEEYRALSGYVVTTTCRSRKPRGSVAKVTLDDEQYVPMPLGT